MSTQTTSSVEEADLERHRWRIDPARSHVAFQSRTFWGLVTVRGQFDRFDGTLQLSNRPAIELTIEAQSLDTNNDKRDTHLCSADFFDVEKHPQVRFVSESATLDGDRLHVHGHLHAAGKSIRLDLDATLRQIGDELKVKAVTDADHRKLGMTWNKLGMLRSPSTLIVNARLVPEEK